MTPFYTARIKARTEVSATRRRLKRRPTYTFTWRKGVKFSDGNPLMKAMKLTANRALDPKMRKLPSATWINMIKEAKVADDHTLGIWFWSHPYTPLLTLTENDNEN